MINNLLKEKFDDLRDNKDGLSSVKVEAMLKSLGFDVARKTLSVLSAYKIIKAPVVVHEGDCDLSKRVLYGLDSVMDLIAFLLSVEAVGIKGRNAENKLRFYKYAVAIIKGMKRENDDISSRARFEALAVASFFVDDNLPLKDRLEAAKTVQDLLYKVIITLWFTKKLLTNDSSDDIIIAWQSIRNSVITPRILTKFMVKLNDCAQHSADSIVDSLEEIKKIAQAVKNHKEAEEDFKALLEMMMVFSKGKLLIASEVEAYMKSKHSIVVDLKQDTCFKVLALYRQMK